MKKVVFLAFVLILLSTALSLCVVGLLRLQIAYASPYANINVDTAYNMITSGLYPDLVVLDVRTKSEYDGGHIYDAVWIPVSNLSTRIGELAGHENHEIIVYCAAGGRSATASGILDSHGFTKVYNMLGGISEWQLNGYPVWIATVHNLNTTFNYDTIQAAIDAPQTLDGHTIKVDAGTYYGHVVVNKPVSLIGENKDTTIIDGNGTGNVLMINYTAPNVTIENFTIRNVAWASYSAVCVVGDLYYWYQDIKQNVTIKNNNIIFGHFSGVWIGEYCYGVTVSNNNISNNYWGIYALNSGFNTITGNNISYNDMCGIGIQQHMGYYNEITNNYISNNKGDYGGIFINWVGGGNILTGNDIIENSIGIEFDHATDPYANTIFHNNFINNTIQIKNTESNNTWDNDYPSGGNYWSNYTDVDVKSGPAQDLLGGDGIGDVPHTIDENNKDGFPLMGPFNAFEAGTWDDITYYVHIVSNSTISDFNFNSDEKLISFNVTASSPTIGFCRVTIPNEILWCDTPGQWIVLVNSTAVPYRVIENGNYTYLYFNYSHSIQNVQIKGIHVIPEFPAWTSMLLILTVLAVAIVISKRKLLKHLK